MYSYKGKVIYLDDNEQKLLLLYLKIWNNRQLDYASEDKLIFELIRRELLDENTHPRVRKNKFEKFYTSIERLSASELKDDEKVLLLDVYVQMMKQLKF